MINIVLSIVFFSIVVTLFKLFERFRVVSLHAITVNYALAATFGIYFSKSEFDLVNSFQSDWIFHAIAIGCMFITAFNLLALGAQKVGLTISTVANKMSLVIPVGFSLIFYPSDSINLLKATGILLALTGVYFSSTNGKQLSFNKDYLWSIIVIFIVQGLADIVFNHAQRAAVQPDEMENFFGTLFLFAFIAGLLASLPRLIKKQTQLKPNALLFGVLVGIPNYLTLVFFFKALATPSLEPSVVYPFVSMGVILTSALIGLLFFKEKLSVTNWIGVLLAILSIATLAYA